MRKKSSLLVVVTVVLVTLSLTLTGQEEPLPVVQAKTPVQVTLHEPTVAMAMIRTYEPPSLAEAARANDFVTFEFFYAAAKARGENVGPYAPLHELWSWSMSDPVGAFYGPAIHDRLAAAYPGFARYIDDFRIVDSNGNIFYPTSETRSFLLDRATEGRIAPRLQIASAASAPARARTRTTTPTTTTTTARATTTTTTTTATKSPRRQRSTPKRATTPKAAPVETHTATTTPIVTTEPPLVVKAEPAPAPAPTAATTPAPAPTPVQSAPVESAPIASTPVETQVPAPTSTPTQAPVSEPAKSEAPASETGFGNRGILLLVIGLIGVGLLALILRAPKEAPPSIMPTPTVGDKPAAPVEPFRKTPAPGSVKSEETPKKPRATGSHG